MFGALTCNIKIRFIPSRKSSQFGDIMISDNLKQDWAKTLTEKLHQPMEIRNIHSIGGGDINRAYRLDTDDGSFFVKMNDSQRYPNMLSKEANGLVFLSRYSVFSIPKVIAQRDTENVQWLMMELISSSAQKSGFWTRFGQRLAMMHQSSAEEFGLDEDNYIGSLHQYNSPREKWGDFFAEMRIEPLLKLASDQSLASEEMKRLFKNLLKRADDLFPEEPPAAVHGDLWSGNFMSDSAGEATIYDPAVYFGHREMDLGMTKLFGGFDREFYQAYQETYPLEKGWEERVGIANLYPLLVHLNLFGTSYASQILGILRRFS
jgi:fructosamine-3-kinase